MRLRRFSFQMLILNQSDISIISSVGDVTHHEFSVIGVC